MSLPLRSLLVTVVAVVLAGAASAQLALRPMVGINSATFTTDFDDETFKSQLGYQVGVDLMIGGRFYVAPGVLFEVNQTELQDGNGQAYTIDLKRVTIPLHLGFKLLGAPTERAFDIRIFGGPVLAINLDSEIEFSENFDKDNLKDAMWGWDVGAGVDFLIFFVEGGYRFGLSNVFGSQIDNDSKQDLFFANAGVRIRF